MLTMVASRIVMIVPSSTTPSATHLYSSPPMPFRAGSSTWSSWVAATAASTVSRVSTSVMRNLLPAIGHGTLGGDLLEQVQQHGQLGIAQRRQGMHGDLAAAGLKTGEQLLAERGRGDADDATIGWVWAPLSEPLGEQAVNERCRRAQRAAL